MITTFIIIWVRTWAKIRYIKCECFHRSTDNRFKQWTILATTPHHTIMNEDIFVHRRLNVRTNYSTDMTEQCAVRGVVHSERIHEKWLHWNSASFLHWKKDVWTLNKLFFFSRKYPRYLMLNKKETSNAERKMIVRLAFKRLLFYVTFPFLNF